MTRISTTPAPIRKPDSVSFGELAIAAGLAGKPISVCFSENSANVDCELWKYFTQLIGPERVLHVHTQADIRKLTKFMGHWRLVVVHSPRLHNIVTWTVQMQDSGPLPCPTVFSRSIPASLNESPIASLVLRGNTEETSSIIHWLLLGRPRRTAFPVEQPIRNVEMDPALYAVTIPSQLPNGRGPKSLRDCQLLTSLLCGACLLRNVGQSSEPSDGLTVNQDDYGRIRQLLQSAILCTADEPVDQLAVDMVNRANVYLHLKCNPELLDGNLLHCDDGDPIRRIQGSRTLKDLITRREIADLGNIRSRLVHQIVDVLQRLPEGYELFQKMGLACRLPTEQEWKNQETNFLRNLLRSWSYKQIRSHFDILRRDGLITGERERVNAPWLYRLPDELSITASPFHRLPTREDLYMETVQSN